jgi:hypothetical protein
MRKGIGQVPVVMHLHAVNTVALSLLNGVGGNSAGSACIRRQYRELMASAGKGASHFVRQPRCAAIPKSGVKIWNDKRDVHGDMIA